MDSNSIYFILLSGVETRNGIDFVSFKNTFNVVWNNCVAALASIPKGIERTLRKEILNKPFNINSQVWLRTNYNQESKLERAMHSINLITKSFIFVHFHSTCSSWIEVKLGEALDVCSQKKRKEPQRYAELPNHWIPFQVQQLTECLSSNNKSWARQLLEISKWTRVKWFLPFVRSIFPIEKLVMRL